jgi:CheY-like chemotaxis protein
MRLRKIADVDLADNGLIALEKVKQHLPCYYDAILIDINMPIMDGYEASDLIDQHFHKISDLKAIISLNSAKDNPNHKSEKHRCNFDPKSIEETVVDKSCELVKTSTYNILSRLSPLSSASLNQYAPKVKCPNPLVIAFTADIDPATKQKIKRHKFRYQIGELDQAAIDKLLDDISKNQKVGMTKSPSVNNMKPMKNMTMFGTSINLNEINATVFHTMKRQ